MKRRGFLRWLSVAPLALIKLPKFGGNAGPMPPRRELAVSEPERVGWTIHEQVGIGIMNPSAIRITVKR